MSEDKIIDKKLIELERKIDSAKNPEEAIQALRDYRNYFKGIVDTFQGQERLTGRMVLSITTANILINITRIELIDKFTNLNERMNKIETMLGELEKYK